MLDMQDKVLRELPFYSWQCITIQLTRRDVNLVIPDESNMMDLLTLLISKMNTIDGTRDSATLVKHMIVRNRTYQHTSQKNNQELLLQKLKNDKPPKLTKIEQMKLVKSTLLKLKVLKFRAKLSYLAYSNLMTI